MENSIDYNRPAFLCYVELMKAFARAKLTDVIPLLIERDVRTNLIKIVEDVYSNAVTKVQIGSIFSEDIKCNSDGEATH